MRFNVSVIAYYNCCHVFLVANKQQNSLLLAADLRGDLPQCPVVSLEGHQNRVTQCIWNANKNQLASMYVPLGFLALTTN